MVEGGQIMSEGRGGGGGISAENRGIIRVKTSERQSEMCWKEAALVNYKITMNRYQMVKISTHVSQ